MNVAAVLRQRFNIGGIISDRLFAYVAAVQESPINLTAWSGDTLWDRGVFDSLVLGALLGVETGRGLDIGSGGGFPGMVLAIAHPKWSWVLLDSRQRRGDFLRATAENLGLANVYVAIARAEEWIWGTTDRRQSFDAVTLRAVAATRASLELGLPYVSLGGRLVLVKGPDGPNELALHEAFIAGLGGQLTAWESGTVQGVDGRFDQIAVIDKVASTPENYPRGANALGR